MGQEWWEFNARNQITLWGPDGLIANYHQPQWQLFINELLDALKNNVPYSQTAFLQKNMETIAQPWQHATNIYPVKPVNDTIVVACDLYVKWNTLKDTKTCQSLLA